MTDPLAPWWHTISLRTKITAVSVFLVTLGLLVAGVGTMTVLRNYLLSEVDSKITATVSDMTVNSDTCNIVGPNDYFVAVLNADGSLYCHNEQDDPAPLLSQMISSDMSTPSEPSAFTLWDSGHTTQWRLAAVPGANKASGEQVALVVGLNLNETNSIINNYAAIFLGFGLSVVILGAALTRLLVTSTLGPLRQVEATAAAIADGNFSERLSGATPNTEVGRLNQSLNTMLARIDRAFSDRANTIDQMRRFVGDASHELRTPLVSVRGYAELYRIGALTTPEEIGQAMGRIEKEAIRMGGLVEDLLELARIDESKPLQMKPVDLVPIAYDAASDAMASAPDREITVVFPEPSFDEEFDTDDAVSSPTATGEPGTEVLTGSLTVAAASGPLGFAGGRLARLRPRRSRSPQSDAVPHVTPARATLDTPAIVLGEENKIRQVVTNLIGNAMRFTDAGTPIELGVSVDHVRGVALLDIIDHGEGVAPQIRAKIFQRFWRADTSRTRETGGSGLGLAIVAGIVIAHQGEVEVLDTEGGGATFRVALPLLPEGWQPAVSAPSE